VAKVNVGVPVRVGKAVAKDGRGEIVEVRVEGITGSTRTVWVATGVGVRYGS